MFSLVFTPDRVSERLVTVVAYMLHLFAGSCFVNIISIYEQINSSQHTMLINKITTLEETYENGAYIYYNLHSRAWEKAKYCVFPYNILNQLHSPQSILRSASFVF